MESCFHLRVRWVLERSDRFAIVVAVAVAVGLATVGAASVAQGQQPSARDRAQARAAFQRGERAFDAGRTEEALDDFRRAFRLAPHDAVRFNIKMPPEVPMKHQERAWTSPVWYTPS